MKFSDYIKEHKLSNFELQNTLNLIQADIRGASSYIKAGHDVDIVLQKIAEQAAHRFAELDFHMQGKQEPKIGPDMKALRPLDKL
jgi:hypothetical protein